MRSRAPEPGTLREGLGTARVDISAVAARFEALVFDWDGTAVPDRHAGAGELRRLVEEGCALGLDLAAVSGTHLSNVDGQLAARPPGPGTLHLLLNRGSEAYRVTEAGPELVHRRTATTEEEAALTAAADSLASTLSDRGLRTQIVYDRLNRRKIDLIPEPEWGDPPKERIAELLAAVEERLAHSGIRGLGEVVELAQQAAAEAGIPAARITTDAKHVEIGLTDKADSARFVFGDLWRRGIGPGLVLVIGDEVGPLGGVPGSDSRLLAEERATAVSVGVEPDGVPDEVTWVGGGPQAFLEILADQVERRRRGELPRIDPDPRWTLQVRGIDHEFERVHESLLTLGDGLIGCSGSALGTHPAGRPTVLAGGIYRGEGPGSELLPAPLCQRLALELGEEASVLRVLDLHTGVLHHELATGKGSAQGIAFCSLARPGTAVLRARGDSPVIEPGPPLVSNTDKLIRGSGKRDHVSLRLAGKPGGVAAAASQTLGREDGSTRLDRLAAYRAHPDRMPSEAAASEYLRRAEQAGFERLLVEHRTAWAERWEEAAIELEGDDALAQAIRFTLFHLMASVATSGEAAVGARGQSGPAYRGHVFWDAEVFVLPFLAATCPSAARAMLEYRIRRLPAALAAARGRDRSGARFPWESAATGEDVTPTEARDRTGRVVAITTGRLEEHVVADVAWGACCYSDWTGDEDFLAGPGRGLLIETARYWASRAERDADGRAHIRAVTGPDEYHENVDDNAYTNVMARWNLRRAAQFALAHPGADVDRREREGWLELAGALVDCHDTASGIHEQFAGYYGLEPLLIADVAPRRPVAAEALLGRERVAGSQVIKQADVLMLHHLVPGEVASGSLERNLDFYEPRTAHGSSLSPGIHAALFARAGRFEEALRWLGVAARIDLDDMTGTTAGGLHLATLGSVWQALALGVAGLRPEGNELGVDPRLPPAWKRLEIRVRFRASRVRIRLDHDGTTVQAEPPVRVLTTEGRRVSAGSQGVRLNSTSKHRKAVST